MGLATTTRDDLQALLDQREDEIIKPKRTAAVQVQVQHMRRSWERFCREILQRPLDPEVNPLERLHQIRDRDLQVFFRWRLQTTNVRKIRTLLNYIKNWSMMYRDDVGRPADQDMIKKINTFSRTTLTKDFELDATATLKESTNENDLYHLLIYLWMQDTHTLPVERQRVQQGFITLLIALTSVRPGGIVESGCYRGTNEALLYNNVVLRLVRDPEDRDKTVLLMAVTVVL